MKEDVERALKEAIESCGYIGADYSVPPILREALRKLRALPVISECHECGWFRDREPFNECEHPVTVAAVGADADAECLVGYLETPPAWCPLRGKP
jgi:hypothetical protein